MKSRRERRNHVFVALQLLYQSIICFTCESAFSLLEYLSQTYPIYTPCLLLFSTRGRKWRGITNEWGMRGNRRQNWPEVHFTSYFLHYSWTTFVPLILIYDVAIVACKEWIKCFFLWKGREKRGESVMVIKVMNGREQEWLSVMEKRNLLKNVRNWTVVVSTHFPFCEKKIRKENSPFLLFYWLKSSLTGEIRFHASKEDGSGYQFWDEERR